MMGKIYYIFRFCLIIVIFTCSALAYTDVALKPARFGVLNLYKDIDLDKPLAAHNTAGWVYSQKDNVIIGYIGNKWILGYSLSSLKPLWWLNLMEKGSVASPFQIIGDYLVFSYSDGNVFCIRVRDGKLLWKTKLDSVSFRLFSNFDNKIFVMTYTQKVYAIDLNSGVILWIYDHDFDYSIVVRSLTKPLVFDKIVIAGMSSGDIVGIDISTGNKLWQYVFNKDSSGARFYDIVGEISKVDSNKILFSRTDGVVALLKIEGSDVQLLWSKNLTTITTSTLLNNKYYVGCLNGDVYVIDALSGDVLWVQQTYQPIFFIYVMEDRIYTISTYGRIYALWPYNGKIVWHDDVQGYIHIPPFVISDKLYIPTAYNNLYIYKLGH